MWMGGRVWHGHVMRTSVCVNVVIMPADAAVAAAADVAVADGYDDYDYLCTVDCRA